MSQEDEVEEKAKPHPKCAKLYQRDRAWTLRLLSIISLISIGKIWRDEASMIPLPSHAIKRFERILDCLHLPPSSLAAFVLICLKYIHRLRLRHMAVVGMDGFETRLWVVGMMLAVKMFDDYCGGGYAKLKYKEKVGFWSHISGLEPIFLKNMEIEFLKGINYNLAITEEELISWRKIIEQYALDSGVASGFALNILHSVSQCLQWESVH